MLDLDALDRLAQAATKGPWFVVRIGDTLQVEASDEMGSIIAEGDSDWFTNNARYIAAANPDTIAALIALLRESQAMLRRLEWTRLGFDPYCPICGNYDDAGHAPDCELAALLAALPGAADTKENTP